MKLIMKTFVLGCMNVLFAGCQDTTSKDIYTYSIIAGGAAQKVDLTNNIKSSGHEITEIEDCSSKEVKKCIMFGNTFLAVPDDLLSGYISDGEFPSLGLSYSVEPMNLPILNYNISGFFITLYDSAPGRTKGFKHIKFRGEFFYSLHSHNKCNF